MNYDLVEIALKKSGIPKMEFYTLIGLTPEGYRGMMKNKTMKISTLEKISEILEIPIGKFFSDDTTLLKEPDNTYQKTNLEQQVADLKDTVEKIQQKLKDKTTE